MRTGYSLDVANLRADVGRRAAHGGVLVMVGEGAKLVLNLASTAIFARMLAPEAFGLLAMVVALTGLAGFLAELGLSAATVQRREITEAQVNSLFWINAAAGGVFALGVAAIAPAIAWFYGEPRLLGITVVLAGALFFAGLGIQHRALLQRQMRFSALVAIDVLAAAGGIAVALLLAARGYGYWALVANVSAASVFTAALSWVFSGWRPGRPSKVAGLTPLLSFGGHVTAFTLVNYFSRNLDNVLIGWWWGPSALALYDRAYKLFLLPIQKVNAPVARVMVPALSHIEDDGKKWARAYCRSAMAVLLVGAPLSTFCFVFADLIIRILLGSQWAGAVPIFRCLAVSGMAQCLCNTVGWIYLSNGRADRMFRWGAFGCAAVCLAFLIGLPYGPIGVALAYSTTSVALTVPCILYACRSTPLKASQVFSAALPPVLASALAALAAYATRVLAGPNFEDAVLPAIAAFCVTYVAFVLPWPGPRDTIALAARKVLTAR